VLGSVSKSILLTALWGGRERFALDNGPLLSPGFAAARTDDFVLRRFRRYVAGFQKLSLFHAFHLLPGECLARAHTPKKEESGS
jgi:hypothetical protein